MKTTRLAAGLLCIVTALAIGPGVSASAKPLPVRAGIAAPAQFPPSSLCKCHGDLVQEWSSSMHGQQAQYCHGN